MKNPKMVHTTSISGQPLSAPWTLMAFSSRLPAMSLDDAKRVASEAHPALSAPRRSAPSPRAGDPFGLPHPLGMMSAPSGDGRIGKDPLCHALKTTPGD